MATISNNVQPQYETPHAPYCLTTNNEQTKTELSNVDSKVSLRKNLISKFLYITYNHFINFREPKNKRKKLQMNQNDIDSSGEGTKEWKRSLPKN